MIQLLCSDLKVKLHRYMDEWDNRVKKQYTAVDIFSGAGGMSIGAKMAGIKPVMAVELDLHAAETYKANHPDIAEKVLQEDIQFIKPLEHTDKNPFILFGGPPCQGFSIANTKTRNLENPNNSMFREYRRFVKELEPEWFVFENVVGFKSLDKGNFVIETEKALQKLGYTTSSAVLNASDFGVPQYRKRFFIVGHRDGITFDFSTLQKQKTVTVGEALEDLPSLSNGDMVDKLEYKSPAKSDFAKLMRKKLRKSKQNFVTESKPHIIKRYEAIDQGENWEAAKRKGLLSTYSSTKHTHSAIYRRLEAHKPSITISNYRKSMTIHPIEHRGLSLREAARLQSFPDDFIFKGTLSFQQQQVGNAVPPLLAKAIFDQIISLSHIN